MIMSTDSVDAVARYERGDVVRVRDEPWLSIVALPTHERCEVPPDAPDLGAMCCVPIALVRSPADDENGPLRWVELQDLTPAGDDDGDDSPVPP